MSAIRVWEYSNILDIANLSASPLVFAGQQRPAGRDPSVPWERVPWDSAWRSMTSKAVSRASEANLCHWLGDFVQVA